MVGRYWWSQQDKSNKIHWLSWDLLTLSKKKGGLGFQDLCLFNLAMPARQAWRLLTEPNTICGKILQARYFPNSSIIQCKARNGISYTWRSILLGINLLKEELFGESGLVQTLEFDLIPGSQEVVLEGLSTQKATLFLQKFLISWTRVQDPGMHNW
jgi:hypothetical protein